MSSGRLAETQAHIIYLQKPTQAHFLANPNCLTLEETLVVGTTFLLLGQ